MSAAHTDTFTAVLQDRRILFFPGLTHHTQRLAPLVRRLEDLQAHVICATTQNVNFGCDFKGDFEVPLVRDGRDYLFLPEQFESEVANDLIRDYHRAERAIAEAVRASPPWTQRLAVAAVRLRTMIGLEHDRLVDKLLNTAEPELVLVLHEYNCWTRPLCAQALRRGIPVLSFIEGLPYETLPSGMFSGRFSSRICLWGMSHHRRLVADGTDPAKLAVIGAIHLDAVRHEYLSQSDAIRRQFGLPVDKKVVLLVMPRLCFSPSLREIVSSLAAFVDSRPTYCLAIKWHPHERQEDLDRLHLNTSRITCFQYEDVLKLTACSDVVLCSGSTVGGEALAFDKPLIEINWGGKNVNLNYTRHGVCTEVRTEADWGQIDPLIDNDLPADRRQAVDAFVEDSFHRLDGETVDRAVEQVVALLARGPA